MTYKTNPTYMAYTALLLALCLATSTSATTYPIVDTGQITSYNNQNVITAPTFGEAFYGQDAQFAGHQPTYTVSQDGLTVYDEITGLTWTQMADTDGNGILESPTDKLTWAEVQAYPTTLNTAQYGGYDDWRLPTIKELYSLILFSGEDINPEATSGGTPFIDTDAFTFVYGNTSAGERIIDAQYWSCTEYVSTTMNGDATVFGVNFADGRIKGYPRDMGPGGWNTMFALCVRGNPDYGINAFTNNDDGTITDTATGLMWSQDDSGSTVPSGMNWEDALAWIETQNAAQYLGYNDWRLPNAKELQSILDYTRSPDTSGSAAIDPVFNTTVVTNEAGNDDYAFYWTGTTHANPAGGASGAYVSFGRSLGYMFGSWIDVHGAGCQRSDPKDGDPADWPTGHGPQGDAIRIYNLVRCVRDAEASIDVDTEMPEVQNDVRLEAAPNPFNPIVEIAFSVPTSGSATLSVYDLQGRRVTVLLNEYLNAGRHTAVWDGKDGAAYVVPSGVYLVKLASRSGEACMKVTLSK